MLTLLEITNRQGTLLTLPLDDDTNGIIVESIEGLNPVQATLVSSSFAQIDGAQYHSSRREARNIKIRLALDPDYITTSVRDLRQKLYDFFMPKTKVTLRFHLVEGEGVLDFLDVHIEGRIETFESPMFTNEPSVDISIMCFDPDFHDPTPVVFNGSTTAGSEEVILNYSGTVETGILFTLSPARAVSAFTIYHRPPDGKLRTLDFSAPLVASDILQISTIVGAKHVTLKRANVESSLLYAMSPQSHWLEIQPGENNLRVYAEGLAIPYSITYSNKYGGL